MKDKNKWPLHYEELRDFIEVTVYCWSSEGMIDQTGICNGEYMKCLQNFGNRVLDVDWINMTSDRDRWRALVNTMMNLEVP
jgi:hypothetical protein